MNNFSKNLLKRNTIYIIAILAVAGIMFLMAAVINGAVSGIDQKQLILNDRSNALQSLAVLRGQAEKANPYLSLLENIIPPHDQLLSFSKELEILANKNKLDFSFAFGEEKKSSGNEPGYISFKANLTGGYDGFTSFLKDIETSRYFVDVASVDLTRNADDFSAVINGRVFYR